VMWRGICLGNKSIFKSVGGSSRNISTSRSALCGTNNVFMKSSDFSHSNTTASTPRTRYEPTSVPLVPINTIIGSILHRVGITSFLLANFPSADDDDN